jgi:hypothetical protein
LFAFLIELLKQKKKNKLKIWIHIFNILFSTKLTVYLESITTFYWTRCIIRKNWHHIKIVFECHAFTFRRKHSEKSISKRISLFYWMNTNLTWRIKNIKEKI